MPLPTLDKPGRAGDYLDLDMFFDVDDARMETGSTRTMIFGVAKLIAYVSGYVTLSPGDLIFTGTPSGMSEGKKPEAVYPKAGNRMRLGIPGLGKTVLGRHWRNASPDDSSQRRPRVPESTAKSGPDAARAVQVTHRKDGSGEYNSPALVYGKPRWPEN